MPDIFVPHALMHLSAAMAVAALALRDQLKLRMVLFVSICVSAAYNAVKSPPDHQAMMWNAVSLAINVSLMTRIVLDRTERGMSEEERTLFDALKLFTPGEFRTVMTLATWHSASAPTRLTVEGETAPSLFYVLDGAIAIDKGDRHFVVADRTFIGEIGFLHDRHASATVSVEAGARYVEWPVAALRARLDDRPRLRQALIGVISFDMAGKVARA